MSDACNVNGELDALLGLLEVVAEGVAAGRKEAARGFEELRVWKAEQNTTTGDHARRIAELEGAHPRGSGKTDRPKADPPPTTWAGVASLPRTLQAVAVLVILILTGFAAAPLAAFVASLVK